MFAASLRMSAALVGESGGSLLPNPPFAAIADVVYGYLWLIR